MNHEHIYGRAEVVSGPTRIGDSLNVCLVCGAIANDEAQGITGGEPIYDEAQLLSDEAPASPPNGSGGTTQG